MKQYRDVEAWTCLGAEQGGAGGEAEEAGTEETKAQALGLRPEQDAAESSGTQGEAPTHRGGIFDIRYRLYDRVKLSVKQMNVIIAGLILLLVLMIAYAAGTTRGFRIRYEAQGGTPVAEQRAFYGDKLKAPKSERQGFRLIGWSQGPDSTRFWNFEEFTVSGDLTLYAQWEQD